VVGTSRGLLERAATLIAPPRLIAFALFAFVVAASARTDADADLWGHLIFGRDTARAGAVISHDTYSFTTDRPWVNHEWLAEVLMWQAWHTGGSAGIVTAKLGVILATLGVVWGALAAAGVARGLAVALTLTAWIGILPRFTTFRPQIFSALLFALVLAVLADVRRRRRPQGAWTLPFIFAAWVNLHGGWLVGAAVLAVCVLATLAERRIEPKQAASLALISVLSAAATLANPYGWRLWQFLWQTVGFGRDDILDWQPIAHVPAHFVPWLLVTVALGIIGWLWRPRIDAVGLLIPAVLWVGTLKVNRLDAFFALAAVVLPQFGDRSRRLKSARDEDTDQKPVDANPKGGLPSTTLRPGKPTRHEPDGMRAANGTEVVGRIVIGGTAALAIAAVAALHVGREMACVRIGDAPAYPEPQAEEYIRKNALRGRMLTFYDYGEYAIWHFAPGLQVSLDGRRETVYSDAVLEAHRRFFESPSLQRDFPGRLGADHIWLPNYVDAGEALESTGYIQVFRGPKSTIWSRQAIRTTAPPGDEGARCFPGP
jgi:hypothetical protein